MKVKVSIWQAWEIVTPASTGSACIRRDPDTGNLYQWIAGGKRVTVKLVGEKNE